MLRLIVFLLVIVGVGSGLAWLADRPGNLTINWQGTQIETSVFTATWVSVLAIFLLFVAWSIFRTIWHSPAAVGQYFRKRRQARGLDALSSGMIAIGSGDRESAMRHAIQARKDLPNEPLTHLLRAQAAQLTDDRATSRRIYEGMLGSRDTEALGLRGLFLEAQKEGETEAARQFAQRALALNAKLGWASSALFDMQCKAEDWAGALQTLASARKNGLVEKSTADRRRAVLLTAQAQLLEDDDADKALKLALEAHGLAPKLVPAADIAGRLLASRGNTARAAKVLQNTWKRSPHPDLAMTYAHARPGDSPRDRLTRVKALARLTPHTIEAPIALATAAIEAHDWDEARKALEPLLDKRITQRVCTLMAQIEAEQNNDAGRVREWLARAANAPRDPTWTADGITSDQWAPISPVTGQLDAFEWRVPVEAVDKTAGTVLTQRLQEFVALADSREKTIEAPARVVADPASPVAPPPQSSGKEAASQKESATPSTPADGPAGAGERPTATAATATAPARTGAAVGTAAGAADPDSTGDTASATTKDATVSPKDDDVIVAEPVTTPVRIASKTGHPDAHDTKSDADSDGQDSAAQTRIFVPPRAPDDPGPDTGDPDHQRAPMSSFRSGHIKGTGTA